MSGNADPAFFASLPENIAPSTDDNPFFFFTQRLSNFVVRPASALPNNNAAISMTLVLLIVALGACGYYIVAPSIRLAKRMPLSTLTPPVTYFSAIGMGFMLIEISQMQRLMVFLGHPVYGLAVVLFTILLFSGIGSTSVDAHYPRPGAVIARTIALLTTLVVAGLLTPLLITWARSAATDVRILLSVLLLSAPLPQPKLVVPNFPDLTIKIRQTSGEYSSLKTLYLKGARQRSEYVMQNAGTSMDDITITQCDKNLLLNLNNKEKTYASFPIEDWTTRIKRADPTPPEPS